MNAQTPPFTTKLYAPPNSSRLRLEAFDDVTCDAEPHLIEDLIPTVGVGSFFGASLTYKSFTCINIGFHVACGLPWAGKQVKQANVVYIASEGAAGVRKRIVGLKKQFPGVHAPFHLLGATVNLGTEKGDLDEIIALVDRSAVVPGFIVIDTLSSALAAGDENGPGMTQFIANCQKLAERFNAFVLVVHHIGHYDDKRERGHSSIIGNVDVRIRAERKDKLKSQIAFVKVKDGEDGLCFDVALRKIEVGLTTYGKPMATLVVDSITPLETSEETEGDAGGLVKKPTSKAAILRRAFVDAYGRLIFDAKPLPGFDGHPVRKVAPDAVRDELRKRGFLEVDDAGHITSASRSAFLAAKTSLLDKTVFVENEGLLWQINPLFEAKPTSGRT